MEGQQDVDLDWSGGGKDLGESLGRETTIRIYCMKKNLFSVEEKKENKKVKSIIENF